MGGAESKLTPHGKKQLEFVNVLLANIVDANGQKIKWAKFIEEGFNIKFHADSGNLTELRLPGRSKGVIDGAAWSRLATELPALETFNLFGSDVSSPPGGLPLSALPKTVRFLFLSSRDEEPALRWVGDLTADNAWCLSIHDSLCLNSTGLDGMSKFKVTLGATQVDGQAFVNLVRDVKAGRLSQEDARKMMASADSAAPATAVDEMKK